MHKLMRLFRICRNVQELALNMIRHSVKAKQWDPAQHGDEIIKNHEQLQREIEQKATDQ